MCVNIVFYLGTFRNLSNRKFHKVWTCVFFLFLWSKLSEHFKFLWVLRNSFAQFFLYFLLLKIFFPLPCSFYILCCSCLKDTIFLKVSLKILLVLFLLLLSCVLKSFLFSHASCWGVWFLLHQENSFHFVDFFPLSSNPRFPSNI